MASDQCVQRSVIIVAPSRLIVDWPACCVQNHRGAMMELGEGLCKLRRLKLDEDGDAGDGDGPFSRFRDEVAAVLQFLYRTQKELAACTSSIVTSSIVDLC